VNSRLGASDEEDEASDSAIATEGFESLLDLASSFIQSAPLDWHYRSRDERLISFSNHHIYDERLVVSASLLGGSLTKKHWR
jgi:superfamily I DNA and/or RNA helicase